MSIMSGRQLVSGQNVRACYLSATPKYRLGFKIGGRSRSLWSSGTDKFLLRQVRERNSRVSLQSGEERFQLAMLLRGCSIQGCHFRIELEVANRRRCWWPPANRAGKAPRSSSGNEVRRTL